MASDRDTLEYLLLSARIDAKTTDETVDDILDAGWRPPARVIENAVELDALPPGSIVKHSPCRASGRAECVWAMERGWWYGNTTLTPHRSRELLKIHREGDETLTVVWEPEQEARS